MPQPQIPSRSRQDAGRTTTTTTTTTSATATERAVDRLARDLETSLKATRDSVQQGLVQHGEPAHRKQQENTLLRLTGAITLVEDLLSVNARIPLTPSASERTLSPADLVTECLTVVRSQLPEPAIRMELARGRHCDLPLRGDLLRYRYLLCVLMRHVAQRGEQVEVSAAATPRSDGSAQVEFIIASAGQTAGTTETIETAERDDQDWEADRDLLALGRAMLPSRDAVLDQIGVATYSLLLRVPIAARPLGRERAGDQALLEGQHVLVVDDDQALRREVVDLLTEMGARCEQARDGLQALEQCRVSRFDLILMDLDLPNMDGATATSILVANRLRLPAVPPIIALSGVADPALEQRGLDAGAVACLRQPIERDHLHRLLAGLLGRTEEHHRSPATAAQARFLPQRVEETIDLMGGGSEAMEVLQGLIDDYVREVPELLGEIRQIDGAEVGRPRLELVARTLTSRSTALGLMAAAAQALQIEKMAGREWHPRRAAEMLDRFELERRAGLEELQGFLQEGIVP